MDWLCAPLITIFVLSDFSFVHLQSGFWICVNVPSQVTDGLIPDFNPAVSKNLFLF